VAGNKSQTTTGISGVKLNYSLKIMVFTSHSAIIDYEYNIRGRAYYAVY
jgi:hypothetical protein